MRTLRAELDAIAPGYEITVDTTGHVGNYQLAALVAPGAADAIFLMGYDFRGSGDSNAGAIAPLGGELFDVQDAVRSFLAFIPPSALILGVPYYGRAWSTVSDALNAKTQTGTKYGSSVTAEYATAATLAEENGRRYDTVEQSAWTAVPQAELLVDLRLRPDLAPDLLRRRRVARCQVRPRQRSSDCGAPACGPWATTRLGRSSGTPSPRSSRRPRSRPPGRR